jgi:hypothetical protein
MHAGGRQLQLLFTFKRAVHEQLHSERQGSLGRCLSIQALNAPHSLQATAMCHNSNQWMRI